MSESTSPNGGTTKRPRARKSPVKKSGTAESPTPASRSASDTPVEPQVTRSAAAPAKAPATGKTSPTAAQAPPATTEPAGEQVEVIRLTALDRRSMVATAAYYRAERRQFASGHELEDWLAAEADVDALLRRQIEAPRRTGRTA